MTGIYDNIVIPGNSFPNPVHLVASIPNITTAGGFGDPVSREVIRWASYDWAVARGFTPILMNDLSLNTDGVHPIAPGSQRAAWHLWRALRPHFGLSHDDKGATFGIPTHAAGSQDIVIPFTLGAGSTALSIVGAAGSRFKVYRGGDRSTPLTLDATTPIAVDNSAKTLTLKLASDPGQIPLEIVPFGTGDPANDGSATGVFDDLNDGDGVTVGRQVWPGVLPLRVAANMDLTLSNTPTFASSPQGQAMTGGRGVAASNATPSLVTGFSVQLDIQNTGSNGSTEVYAGQNGSGFWIGRVNTDLKVVVGSTTFTVAGAMPADSVWRQILVTVAPTVNTVTVYIDGSATVLGAATPSYGATSAWGIRTFGNNGGNNLTTASVDAVAVFRGVRTYTAAPLTGTEPNLVYLWKLDGGGAAIAA